MGAHGITDGAVQGAERVENLIGAIARSEARQIVIAPEITHARRESGFLVEAHHVVAGGRNTDQAVCDLAISRCKARVLPDTRVAGLDSQPVQQTRQETEALLIADLRAGQFCGAAVDNRSEIVTSEFRPWNIDERRGR